MTPESCSPVKKAFRQGQIVNPIRSRAIRTQEKVAVALRKVRVAVTQITLSRNIRELGLVKGPQGYQKPPEASLARQAGIGMLKWTLEEFARDVKAIHHIVIIKTAQPVEHLLLIPSIARNLSQEFTAHYSSGRQGCREIVMPKLGDFDEQTRAIILLRADHRPRRAEDTVSTYLTTQPEPQTPTVSHQRNL